MVSINNIAGKLVVITGGTAGIGLATAKEYAKHGAKVAVTYNFGTRDNDEIIEEFKKSNMQPPLFFQVDVGNEAEMTELFEELHSSYKSVEVFVSNAAFGAVVKSIDEYSKKDFFSSIKYSTWPLFGGTLKIKDIFGSYPRYAIGLSSYGPDSFHLNYDILAMCKAMLETMIKYFNYHLFDEDIRVNVVKPAFVCTNSLESTMGEDFVKYLKKHHSQDIITKPEEVAKAIFVLSSGLFDAVKGQTIPLDNGSMFHNNITDFFLHQNNN